MSPRGVGFGWTETEDAIIRAHYPSERAKLIVKRLRGRSVIAIMHRAYRLGIKRVFAKVKNSAA